MTDIELKKKMLELNAQFKSESDAYEANHTEVVLDNDAVEGKYKKLRKELLERYLREKED